MCHGPEKKKPHIAVRLGNTGGVEFTTKLFAIGANEHWCGLERNWASSSSVLAQVCRQLFKALIGFQSWCSHPDRVQTSTKVTRWPLSLVAYHQAQKVQRLTWKPPAKTGFMKPMHKVVRVGWRLQPDAEQHKRIRERILRCDTQAAKAFGDGRRNVISCLGPDGV